MIFAASVHVYPSHIRFRVGFQMDMFLPMIDAQGVLRGPVMDACRGAFISREGATQAAAQEGMHPPGG